MKKVIFISFVIFSSMVFGQQIPQYSQWFLNQFAVNPAHAGIKSCLEIKTLYRNQWTNLEGAPNSGFLTFATPLATKRKKLYSARQGIGGKFERDQIGPFTANRFNLSYAAHFNFSQVNRLSVGISAGMQQWIFDKTKTTTLVPDPIIAESNSAITPDVAFGAWWNGSNYYAGLAFQQIPRGSWGEIGDDSRFKLHAMLNGGYRFVVKENVSLLPSAMLRIPPSGPVSMDLAFLIDYQNQIGGGIGLRNQDALLLFLNFKIKEQVGIGYAFDFVISPLSKNRTNTHEITLSFSGCKSRSTSRTICPLFE
jgi:type IX secretion system PorP/SprF family membrane protein